MSRLVAVLAVLCAAIVLTFAASGPSAAVGDCTPQSSWGTVDRSYAQQVLDLVNQHRAGRGLTPLARSSALTAAAEWKSLHMAGYGYFQHSDPAPPVARGVGDRLVACGYPGNAGWGENIAYGYGSPAAVMQGWLDSPGHRANIERASYRSLGVGVARAGSGRLYWTQDFGTATSSTVPPPSPPPAPGDVQPPSVPTGLALTSVTSTSLALRWNASSDDRGVTGYGLYVGTTRIANVTGTSAAVTGRACGTTYTVGVDAHDAAGNRSARTQLTAATAPCSSPAPPATPPSPPAPSPPPATGDTTPPSTPLSIALVSTSPTSVTVAWPAATDNVGVTGYGVYSGGRLVTTTTALTYTFTGLVCGSTWQTFSVRARDAAGNLSGHRVLLVPLRC